MLNAKKKSTTRITTYRKQLTFEADYYTCICLDFVLANKVHQITFIGFSILMKYSLNEKQSVKVALPF